MARAGSHETAATVTAYLVFAATGIGVVLPGTLLASLLARWSLNDEEAGLLFFLFFVGSSCGALLSRGRLSRSIARGCVAIAAGSCMLAAASRVTAFAAMLVYGLGMGLTMTSVSLLQSRRRPQTRTAEMSRLNMTWALGASIGPALMLRGAAHWSVAAVLYALAILFAVFALLALWAVPDPAVSPAAIQGGPKGFRLGTMPLVLFALVPLATGVESSVGGWLAAYSKRDGLVLNQTISTVTCFWAAILLSRLAQHRQVALASQRATLALSPWLMCAGLVLLIAGRGGWYMGIGAVFLGLGVGPVYPLLLALLLGHGEAGNVVFLAGGIGASSLPLLTGLVSGWSGSLARGLVVPLAASAAMGIAALTLRQAGGKPPR